MLFSNDKIFIKIFKIVLVSILSFSTVFFFYYISNQKDEILKSLNLEASSIAKILVYVSSDAIVLNDGSNLVELYYGFLNENKQIKSIILSRLDKSYYIIKRDGWSFESTIDKAILDLEKEDSTSKIIYSPTFKEDVFHYSYAINFSGTNWGWLHFSISLDEYNKKIRVMYFEFFTSFIILIILAIFIAYFIANMIAKPIVKLNNISMKISNGDLSRRVNIETNDEIGRLSQSFNTMVTNLEKSQKSLKDSHEDLEKRVEQRTIELKELNETLEHRVEEEINKQKKQEQLLIQQSKLAAMGEMIGNIAHQWRQPLNTLGLVMQNIQFAYEIGDLDDEFMDRSVKKVNLLTDNMSKTIDDFRNFFKPNKEKEAFDLSKLFLDTLALVESTYKHNNIYMIHNIKDELLVYGFSNEFSQTLLNILNNAKDALIEKKIENPEIDIKISNNKEFAKVEISDNAGGIPEDILEKIFEPYFTTKEEGKGTGIGLYMSKTIIEQNMNGILKAQNIDNGAKFIIEIPLYKE